MNDLWEREWPALLRLLLAQRLELNAIESALKTAGILGDEQLRDLRVQAADTARAWSAKPQEDVLELLRVHSSPLANMTVSPRRAE